MKVIPKIIIVFVFFCALPISSFAEGERGVERVGEGTEDIITSPGQVAEGIGEDGVVAGSAKGSVDAAEQAAGGAVDVGTGAVESVLDTVTGE